MGNPPQLQLLQAVVFFSAGIAVGVVYDVCRAVRRCSGRKVQAGVDVLFVCCAAGMLYVLAMLVGQGQLRIFMVGCVCLGAAAYSAVCSDVVVPLLCIGLRRFKRVVSFALIPLKEAKKFIKTRKNLFPKRYVWSKMNGYSFSMRQFVFKHTRGEKEAEKGHETDRMDDLHRDRCNGSICRVEYRSGAISADSGGGVPHGTDCANR